MILKAGSTIFIAIALIVGVPATLERVYLVNGTSYPGFLAEDAGNVDQAGLEQLRATSCKGDPIEVYKKAQNWVLRCGFAHYQGHTYISHTDPMSR